MSIELNLTRHEIGTYRIVAADRERNEHPSRPNHDC